MQRRKFLLAVPAAAFAQRAQNPNETIDPILKAMKDEMARSKPLAVAGGQPIYFIECDMDDVHSLSVQASMGGLLNVRANAFRIPNVKLRVGDKNFDNTNYIFSELFQGSRFDQGQLPLDNNIPALRHNYWLAIDRAYKTAIEAIGRKKAALRNVTQAEVLPDFSDAPPTKWIEPVAPWQVNEELWKNLAKKWSGIFNAYPEIYNSTVDVEISRDTLYLANTEGTELRMTEDLFYVRTRANGQAPDGMRLRDHSTVVAMGASRVPPETEIEAKVKQVAENLKALIAAPAGENYSGPVLFEAEAAAQLFADLIGGQAAEVRKPVNEPGRPMPVQGGELEGRMGSRILPSSFTVVDDPTQKTYKNRALLGYYPADQEGVLPKPVTLIEKGTLKAFLSTRQPTRENKESNGHARLKGGFGASLAYMSNLFVKSDETFAPAELRAKFLDLIKQRNKPYGLLVRKLDFPSTASIDELRQMVGGTGNRPAPLPLLVYKVTPDGKEELVRGLRFRSLNVRALKDISFTGSDEAQYDFIGNGAIFALVGAGNYIVGCSVVAPSLLFEDLELDRPQIELPKLPVVPPPPSAE
jgi:hypothetical protein